MSASDRRPSLRRLFRLPPRTDAALDAEIDEELESLIAERVDDLVARGTTPHVAREEAARRLGARADAVRAQLHRSAHLRERRMRFDEQLDNLLHDLRYAARGLRRRPAFTAVAVLTLAFGIGGTAAIFSAVNTLLLRPLPYQRPRELMRIALETPAAGDRPANFNAIWSYPKAEEFRKRQTLFSELALYASQPVTITSGEPELIRAEYVSASYLRLLGVTLPLGRNFDPSIDAQMGAPSEVIISDAVWQRRFSGDRAVIGKRIDIDRKPYTVIGVAPDGFLGLTGQGQMLIPLTTLSGSYVDGAQYNWLKMLGRRKPRLTDAQINTALALLGRQVNDAFPDQFSTGNSWSANAHPLDDSRVAPVIKRSLLVLFAAVGFVLLIACVNVANLLIGRASVRRREIAVRLAIGAGRGRLVRLLLTESVLLSFLGGSAGVLVAWLGIHALATVNPSTLRLPRFEAMGAVSFSSIALDWTTLTFALGVALVVGIVFGLAPALHATRASLADAMKDGAGSDTARQASSGRRMLVVTEVALALVLLAGSGLTIRSLAKLLAIDPGFDTGHVLTLRLTVPQGSAPRDSLSGFYAELIDRLRGLPAVTHAALGFCAPLGGGCSSTVIDLMDRPSVELMQRPIVEINWASPEWFAVGRVPLKQGRLFDRADRAGTPKVVIVNEAAARKFWPGVNPVGKRVGLGYSGFEAGADVIGVVGDVRQLADSAAMPMAYISVLQSPRSAVMIFVRTMRDPAAIGLDVRRAIGEIAPAYPIHDMQPLAARAAGATAQARFSALVLALFAATALSLTVVGIYGVLSLAVATRTREMGIRIALGADHRRVQRLVVGEGLSLVAIGAVIGSAVALVSTRVLQTLLFDLQPSDPLTYAFTLVLLGCAAAAASWIPARRASRVNPIEALRAD